MLVDTSLSPSISARQLAAEIVQSVADPMTVAMGFCDLLLTDECLDQNARADIEVVRRYLDKVASVIDGVWRVADFPDQKVAPFRVTSLWTSAIRRLWELQVGVIDVAIDESSPSASVEVRPREFLKGIEALGLAVRNSFPGYVRMTIRHRGTTTAPHGDKVSQDVNDTLFDLTEITITGTGNFPGTLDRLDELLFFARKPTYSATERSLSSFVSCLKDAGALVTSSAKTNSVTFGVFFKQV